MAIKADLHDYHKQHQASELKIPAKKTYFGNHFFP